MTPQSNLSAGILSSCSDLVYFFPSQARSLQEADGTFKNLYCEFYSFLLQVVVLSINQQVSILSIPRFSPAPQCLFACLFEVSGHIKDSWSTKTC